MHIGFTGTRQGMSLAQFDQLSLLLKTFIQEEKSSLHFGLCIGADCEAAEVAFELGYNIIAHPGYFPKNPSWRGSRGSFQHSHTILEEKPFLTRDQDIVNASSILIATPAQETEQRRSGTWATIRYGRKKPDMTVIVINPDGSLVCEDDHAKSKNN